MIKRFNITKELLQKEFSLKHLEILSYTNTVKPILYRCKKCNKEHSILYTNFRKGQGCPYCGGKIVLYQQVKEAFLKEGYELLSQEYINAKEKLDFHCTKCGNDHFITWDSFQQGSRCAYCAGKIIKIEFIREEFKKAGFILLEEKYVNSSQKLRFYCENGQHEHTITWGSFQSGTRCGICDHKYIDLPYVKERFEKEGYTLLSQEYKNSTSKLDFVCPKGHKHSITWADFNSGYRCGYCAGKHKTDAEKRKVFEDAGYIVVGVANSWDYRKTDLICPKGHSCAISRDNFLGKGRRCGVCNGKHFTDAEKKKVFEDEGYKVVGDIPFSNVTKVNLICPNGHECAINRSNFHRKAEPRRCPHCNEAGKSRPEKEIAKTIEETLPNIKIYLNIRDKIKPKELDLYLPEYNLALEYCGIYWHSDKVSERSKKAHVVKAAVCREKGINLITIFEDDWLYKKQQLLDVIFRNINTLQSLSQADISFRRLDFHKAKKFNQENSLQIFHTYETNFGFFHNNELKVVVSGLVEKDCFSIRNITYLNGWFYNINNIIFTCIKRWCKNNNILSVFYLEDLRYKVVSKQDLDKGGFSFKEEMKPLTYVVKGRRRFGPCFINARNTESCFQEQKPETRLLQTRESPTKVSSEEQGSTKGNEIGRITDCGHTIYESKIE
jgi:DNA-directed RNA polymerase subunit RPC12/RpoP